MQKLTFERGRGFSNGHERQETWAISVDVEGFSALLKNDNDPNQVGMAMASLHLLMGAVFDIATKVYPGVDPNTNERLFINQFGDGFLIKPEFWEDTDDRPLLICIAIMRFLISQGIATKAAISMGAASDVQGLYPKRVRDKLQRAGDVRIGSGVMTIIPVMGTAMVNAYGLSKEPSGSLLLVDKRAISILPDWVKVSAWGARQPSAHIVDWVHSQPPELKEFCELANFANPSSHVVSTALEAYFNKYTSLSADWINNTRLSVGLSAASN